MRLYEVQKNGKVFAFARTMGYARDYVREDDPSARKTPQSIYGVDIFTNGMSITVIEIKPDKEGVITKLNSLIVRDVEPEPQPEPVKLVEEKPKQKGKWQCEYCNKLIGLVGGVPRVNPPNEITD